MGVIDFILALMQDMILSAIPALGFAMVFNVPHRALPWCALLGALGHGSRMVMMSAGFNIEWSTFMASLLVGCIGIQWSRWYLAHPKVFTVAAVIPHVPWDLCLYRHDLGGKNRPFWLQRSADDHAVDQFSESLLDCRSALHRAIRTGIMAVSQTPARLAARFVSSSL